MRWRFAALLAIVSFGPESHSESQAPHPASNAAFLDLLEKMGRQPFLPDREVSGLLSAVDRRLQDNPNDADLLFWRAELLARHPEQKEIEAAYTKALEAAEKSKPPKAGTAARSLRALALLAATRDDRAAGERLIRKAIACAPEDPANYRVLVDMQLRGGDPAAVLREIGEAADRHGADRPELESLYFELLAFHGEWDALRKGVERRLQRNPLEADGHHFRGLLAALDGNEVESFAEHWLAVELGPADRSTMARSKSALDAWVEKDEELLAEPLRSLVIGYRDASRPSEAGKAVAALEGLKNLNADADIAAVVMRATALGSLGRHAEVVGTLEALAKKHPQTESLPSRLVLMGESLEAMGKPREAEKLFARANRVAPQAPATRRIFRLGGLFRAVGDGVEVAAIESGSPLEKAGVAAGDVLLELDREILADLPVFERLRTVRLYFGGIITLRTAHGETVRREMDLVYFRN